MDFSALNRTTIIKEMVSAEQDIIVIGGGITGAGIALDAASRGLKVVLVEKQDFASGTSSRSTKLVHGGLRYLKNYEFGLVRQVGRERAILHRNARHIVLPEKMLLPIIKGGSLNRFLTRTGLAIYDLLAGVKKRERKRMLNRQEVLKAEPLLREDILIGAGTYYEYKASDTRLTIGVLKKAFEYGALAANYLSAGSFVYEDGKVRGMKVTDLLNSDDYDITAKYVINATGPWVDEIRRKNDSLQGKRLHLTKGIHITIPFDRLPLKQPVYFDVNDGRMVFAIPRYDKIYIGTTDTDYEGNKEDPLTEECDVEYLLDAVNNMFPSARLVIEDVVASWAGLRPLIHRDGKSPSELSRKDEIFISDSGLISIAGGKLSGYRVMAEKAVDIVMKDHVRTTGKPFVKSITRDIPLSGADFVFPEDLRYLVEYADHKFDEAKQTGITPEEMKKLFYRYGTHIDRIIEKAYEYYNISKNTEASWIRAEVWYSMNHEMTTCPGDFFIRRTEMLQFFRERINGMLDIVCDEMACLLGWTEEEKNRRMKDFVREYEAAVSFKISNSK